MDVTELCLSGLHNIQNALSVIAVSKIMGVETADVREALENFKGIKHRIESLGEINGVTYIDDSKGTNVDATIKAVGCVNTDTLLLLGGKNKGYDYSKLFRALKTSKVIHAILYGENRYALLKSAREEGFEKITVCGDMQTAVRIAGMLAKTGETVLLSPASASFDEFSGYEERGDTFVELVRSFEKQGEEKTNIETDGESE